MIDHIGLAVSDLAKSKAFLREALAPLDYSILVEFPGVAGLGADRPDFWISEQPNVVQTHICFRAKDRATVDAFHRAGLAAGGKDNGPPGLREIYHPTYYGAFILDPDGHNIEAVCHDPA